MVRILVADDNEWVRLMLRLLLLREGHQVVAAADGAEALRAVRGGAFDLLVCDLLMPNKDGLETIRELRRDLPRLRIIAMSGAGTGGGPDDPLHAARLAGADAVLDKPFDSRELLEAVREVLG